MYQSFNIKLSLLLLHFSVLAIFCVLHLVVKKKEKHIFVVVVVAVVVVAADKKLF